jgi:hypothetical protein
MFLLKSYLEAVPDKPKQTIDYSHELPYTGERKKGRYS